MEVLEEDFLPVTGRLPFFVIPDAVIGNPGVFNIEKAVNHREIRCRVEGIGTAISTIVTIIGTTAQNNSF